MFKNTDKITITIEQLKELISFTTDVDVDNKTINAYLSVNKSKMTGHKNKY